MAIQRLFEEAIEINDNLIQEKDYESKIKESYVFLWSNENILEIIVAEHLPRYG